MCDITMQSTLRDPRPKTQESPHCPKPAMRVFFTSLLLSLGSSGETVRCCRLGSARPPSDPRLGRARLHWVRPRKQVSIGKVLGVRKHRRRCTQGRDLMEVVIKFCCQANYA